MPQYFPQPPPAKIYWGIYAPVFPPTDLKGKKEEEKEEGRRKKNKKKKEGRWRKEDLTLRE